MSVSPWFLSYASFDRLQKQPQGRPVLECSQLVICVSSDACFLIERLHWWSVGVVAAAAYQSQPGLSDIVSIKRIDAVIGDSDGRSCCVVKSIREATSDEMQEQVVMTKQTTRNVSIVMMHEEETRSGIASSDASTQVNKQPRTE